MDFYALHHQNQPLILANVWDACSAQVAHQAGYHALGTSSAAMAAMLGYEDGEGMSFEELLFIVARIRTVTNLPLSVDLEAGYGDTVDRIIDNIRQLAKLGVVGINIEDSHVVGNVRHLDDAIQFAGKLQEIAQACPGMFLNARTDTFLLNSENALEETLYRGHLYASSGAHGYFVPCVTRPDDITAIVRDITLPLNVMCMPALADFTTLTALGVKRISMGNFIHDRLQARLKDLLCLVRSHHSFSDVFCDENNR
ncbi:isocitrate lyase/phosphoenolpyruvate mutase family protein [Enterobacter sp. RHBSTW-00994]|uniref:isocitrate lyase/PEP mutase family protein n=1 Tax=Enterobacter sp. RHBSTW-00994 TaxID=2742676 RepID=UPI0015E9F80D|nr:isocitrate lyase/phosphoenolpyruvate mutase family protein [Enterobacter sp. RHBSTW-00994]QLR41250.1 isocitrate lyase/phosphoenolpyruvate mutase family protein [Enterobacter sp. RHBSTW-00994]